MHRKSLNRQVQDDKKLLDNTLSSQAILNLIHYKYNVLKQQVYKFIVYADA